MRLALLAGTMATLAGCMSSPGDQLASIETLPPARHQENVVDKSGRLPGQRVDDEQKSAIAEQALRDANSLNAQPNTLNAQAAAIEAYAAKKRAQLALANNNAEDSSFSNSLVAHKNIAATHNSIFANPETATVENTDDPERVALNQTDKGIEPTQTLNASQNSIYSGQPDQVARDTGAIPMPDAKKVGEVQDLALAGKDVPPDVEVASADPSTAEDPSAIGQYTDQANQDAKTRGVEDVPSYDKAMTDSEQEQPVESKKHRLTLADFFGGKKKQETASFDGNRLGKTRRLSTSAIPNITTASLGDEALPGVNAMMPTHSLSEDEMSEDPDDDQPAGLMKLASLSGMTRLAPNGLWTQTDEVEVRCLRPQLVGMLKQVEQHYGRPVVVTSGYRDPGHNRQVGGARHSLHTLCAAADIQVDGVSKWQLADYLRSIPGRGGVGTYCHTESVHIDIGSERDWNWRCRRRRHG